MTLTGKLADAIKARYSSDSDDIFGSELSALLRRRGMAIFTDEARRELILELGNARRSRNRWDARERARRAHKPESITSAAE